MYVIVPKKKLINETGKDKPLRLYFSFRFTEHFPTSHLTTTSKQPCVDSEVRQGTLSPIYRRENGGWEAAASACARYWDLLCGHRTWKAWSHPSLVRHTHCGTEGQGLGVLQWICSRIGTRALNPWLLAQCTPPLTGPEPPHCTCVPLSPLSAWGWLLLPGLHSYPGGANQTSSSRAANASSTLLPPPVNSRLLASYAQLVIKDFSVQINSSAGWLLRK